MVFSNSTPFPTVITPLSNISPFTYRDGHTYLQILEKMRQWLNETLVPEFNAGIDNAIEEFQKGIENAETRVVESEAAHTLLVNNAISYINSEVADLTLFVNTETGAARAYVDGEVVELTAFVNTETAAAREYVDDSIQFINNKTGQAQIQRISLTGPYTLNIDPLWPNNHPIDIVLTQDATGNHVVTFGANIVGTVPVNLSPNSVTEFKLIPNGDGTWDAYQFELLPHDYVGQQKFKGRVLFSNLETNAFDYTGPVAMPDAGGNAWRASAAVHFTGIGTNGVRGDDISSNEANGAGAAYSTGHFLAVEGSGGWKGRGSIHGYQYRGIIDAHPEGDIYGEMGGFISTVTTKRKGASTQGGEFQVFNTLGAPARMAALTLVTQEKHTTIDYWSRGLWAVSAGGQRAGEGVMVSGSWTYAYRYQNSAAQDLFKVDQTGAVFIGFNQHKLYSDLELGLKTDIMFQAPIFRATTSLQLGPSFFTLSANASGIESNTTLLASNFYTATGNVSIGGKLQMAADATRYLKFGGGIPEGNQVASPGSVWIRTDGGAGSTLYVKESGSGNTGWVAK